VISNDLGNFCTLPFHLKEKKEEWGATVVPPTEKWDFFDAK